MGEEMELRIGSPPRDGETAVMISTDMSRTDPPAKQPPLKMHRFRNLAIASIICGCSCIGVLALIYAVKAKEKQKNDSQDSAVYWARRSRCMSFLSIGVWLCFLILVPLSIILLSYILSQAE
nr:transmembrane protein 265 [Pogona vitticeps]